MFLVSLQIRSIKPRVQNVLDTLETVTKSYSQNMIILAQKHISRVNQVENERKKKTVIATTVEEDLDMFSDGGVIKACH